MNFFRRKNKRNADASASLSQHASSSPDAAGIIQLDPPKMPASCDSSITAVVSEKSKRKSYFVMPAASPAFLRRRNITTGNANNCKEEPVAPAATAIATSADKLASTMFPDSHSDASMTTLTAIDARIQRRRSIMGVSYLMKRRSMHRDLASDSVTAPQLAKVAVHPAKVPVDSRRERERQLDSLVPRRASQCSNGESDSSSSSRSRSSSGDESSGADSDVTLATQDSVDPGAAVLDVTSAGMIDNGSQSVLASAPASAISGMHATSAGSFKSVSSADSGASDDCVDQLPQVRESAAPSSSSSSSLSLKDKGITSRVFFIASSEHVSLAEMCASEPSEPSEPSETSEPSEQIKPRDGHRRSRTTEVEMPRGFSSSAVAANASTGCRSLTDSEICLHARSTLAECCGLASVSRSGSTGKLSAKCSRKPDHSSTSLFLPLATDATSTTAQVANSTHGSNLPFKKPLLLTPPSSMALAKRVDLAKASSAPTLAVATAISNTSNAAVGNAMRPLGRPQRRPLSLGRWRNSGGLEKQQSFSERASLLSLGFGYRHRSNIQDNNNSNKSSNGNSEIDKDSNSRHRNSLHGQRNGFGFGLGRRSVSLGRPSLSL
ncbi:hypothetical protein FB639_003538, partial [Coemansia asiatica]